jgi:PPP family 3-phenylpropionic acid transporter
MKLSSRVAELSPEVRAAAFHFTVYASGATAAISFGIWMTQKGIEPGQIGIINAVPVFLMLLINLFVGRMADKASDWKQMIVILALISGGASIGLFFVHDFWGILLIWTMFNVPSGSIAPLVDAATLRLTQRNGTDFGTVRAWGTVGYVVCTATAGICVAVFGEAAFVPLFVFMSLLRTALAWQLPRFRAPEKEPTLAAINPRAGRLRETLKPWFVLPLLAFGLIQAAHAILGSFAALEWKQQGIPDIAFGPLFATAAAAEAAMMFAWKRVGFKISARHMILAAALVTVFRWAVMAFSPPLFVLFILQAMHAITYAIGYFGTVHFIANWTSEEIAAEAQSFAFVLQQGITVVVLLGFGWLVGFAHEKSFLAMSGLGILAAICILVSLKLKPAK